MVGLAVLFGGLAVMASHSWLTQQADAQMRAIAAQNQTTNVAMSTIVVAKGDLRFGSEISRSAVREIPWPADSVPEGAFASIKDLLNDGERIALGPVETNEPILAAKITGPGQRATLSAIIDEGKRAVTVRVNDVNGVAGFVLPGDRVDVLMTQNSRDGRGSSTVILQGVRVLAVDQMADERAEEPDVAKAVTIEVDTFAAQKVALAASLGELSLVLRRAGEATAHLTRSVTLGDLAPGIAPVPTFQEGADEDGDEVPVVLSAPSDTSQLATVWVSGVDGREEYRVPIERR